MKLEKFINEFKKTNLTLGSIESFMGGLFSSSIVSISGASKFFKGSIVTYATEEKINLLGIDKKIVDEFGVISQQIASEMAKNGKEKLNVDCCISFTGNAGPEALEGKPAGEIHIGIETPKCSCTRMYILKGNRNQIREKALKIGYELILENI